MGWKNGDPLDDRARRRCPSCGGTLYDWGVGPASGWWRDAEPGSWVIEWKCHAACGVGIGHRLDHDELAAIRTGDQLAKDRAAAALDGRPRWIAWHLPGPGNSVSPASK